MDILEIMWYFMQVSYVADPSFECTFFNVNNLYWYEGWNDYNRINNSLAFN